MSTFFFKWVGGITDPAFTVTTTADMWGGSLDTLVDLWGGSTTLIGNVEQDSNLVSNVQDTENLVVGVTYLVIGPGIPANEDGSPSAQFTHDGTNTLSLNIAATDSSSNASLTIFNDGQTSLGTNLQNGDRLVVGRVYGIEAAGLEPGTVFTYDGTPTITLSSPCRTTQRLGSVRIVSSEDNNVIANIGDPSGLVVDQVYNVFGPGVPPGAFFTYDGSGSAVIEQTLTASMVGAPITIRKSKTEDDGGPFDPDVHAVTTDQRMLAFEINHKEGGFATLKVDVKNPRVGLLNPDRKQWCWLSYDPGDGNIKALFHGRLLGAAEDASGEVITIQFLARPNDFYAQKATLAEDMRAPPYWDPLWMQSGIHSADSVLIARPERWHIGRTDLAVSSSHIIDAEDGIIELFPEDLVYSGFKMSYRETPLVGVSMQATLTWTQSGNGDVDLTDELVAAFQAIGSPYQWPAVGTFSGDGLLSTWPQAGASLGQGWSMASWASAVAATWMPVYNYNIKYSSKGGSIQTNTFDTSVNQQIQDKKDAASATGTAPSTDNNIGHLATLESLRLTDNFGFDKAGVSRAIGGLGMYSGFLNHHATFPMQPLFIQFGIHYEANRKRTEILYFSLNADTQSILLNPGGSDTEVIELSSEFVDKPVDENEAMPIGDLRRNCFFPTDRGQQSVQFLLAMAASKLIARGRAVNVQHRTMGWEKIVDLSCRNSILVHDDRLPGGRALGKVVDYTLRMSGDDIEQIMDGEFIIGCSVGYGVALPDLPTVEDSYADDYSSDYDELEPGAPVDVFPGTLRYGSLDGTVVIDDDGVDLFNMTPATVMRSLTITNGPIQQRDRINAGARKGDPVMYWKAAATQVRLELVPVDASDFLTVFSVSTDPLVIPKTIDLEAASV